MLGRNRNTEAKASSIELAQMQQGDQIVPPADHSAHSRIQVIVIVIRSTMQKRRMNTTKSPPSWQQRIVLHLAQIAHARSSEPSRWHRQR
jgi:hypothetical protein